METPAASAPLRCRFPPCPCPHRVPFQLLTGAAVPIPSAHASLNRSLIPKVTLAGWVLRRWLSPTFPGDRLNLQYLHFSYTYAGCFSQGSRQRCCQSGGKASRTAPSVIVSHREYLPWSQTSVIPFGAGSQETVAALSLSTYLEHFLLLAGEAEKGWLKGFIFSKQVGFAE